MTVTTEDGSSEPWSYQLNHLTVMDVPEITVTMIKADKNDFKYEMRRAISEIVEEIHRETD